MLLQWKGQFTLPLGTAVYNYIGIEQHEWAGMLAVSKWGEIFEQKYGRKKFQAEIQSLVLALDEGSMVIRIKNYSSLTSKL